MKLGHVKDIKTGEITLNINSGVPIYADLTARGKAQKFIERNPNMKDWTLPSGKNAASEIYKMFAKSELGENFSAMVEHNLANYAQNGSASPETLHSLAVKLCLAIDKQLNHTDQPYSIQSGLRLFNQAIAAEGIQFDKEFRDKETYVGKICSAYNTLSFEDRSKNLEKLISLVEDKKCRDFCKKYQIDNPSFLVNMVCAGKSLDDIHKILNVLNKINPDIKEKNAILQSFFSSLDRRSYDSFDHYLTTRSYDFVNRVNLLRDLNVPTQYHVAINAIVNIGRVDPLAGATTLLSLLNDGHATLPSFCKGKEKLFRIKEDWLDKEGKLQKIKILREYRTCEQQKIDALASNIYKSLGSSKFGNQIMSCVNNIYERFVKGDFSRDEAMTCLEAILKEKNPKTARSLAESLSQRRALPRHAELFDVIKHVAGNLPVSEHCRILNDYREMMRGEMLYDDGDFFRFVPTNNALRYDPRFFKKPDLVISDSLKLSPRSLHDINTIINFCKEETKYSNVAVYISEMLTEAAAFNEDRTEQVCERLSYLSKLCKKEINNPLLHTMLPSIVDDVCLREKDAVIKECKEKNNYSLKFYLEQSQQVDEYLRQDILNQIKGISAYFKGPQKKQLEYNLVEFARKFKGNEKVSDSLDYLSDIIGDSAFKKMFGLTREEKKFIFDLAYEIAHPDSIIQVGPTCAPTSIEYYLCYSEPDVYLKRMSEIWMELKSDDHDFDLTEVPEEERQEGGLYSSEIFQTIYYNRLFSDNPQIQNDTFGEGAKLLLNDLGIKFSFNDKRHFNYDQYKGFHGLKEWKKDGKAMMNELDQALREGKQVLIAYDKDLTYSSHAALITGYIEEEGKIVAYKMYHGWDMGSKNGRTELITPKRLKNSITVSLTEENDDDD